MLRPIMQSPSWARIARRGPQILFSFCLAIIILCFVTGEFPISRDWGSFELAGPFYHTNTSSNTNATTPTNTTNTTSHTIIQKPKPYPKPKNITVSGLVFYGRKDRVSIMVTYLERNMVNNGGWLDEVVWICNTKNEADLQYLDQIIARDPVRHKKVVVSDENLWVYTYYKAWTALERGKYYVKIDDDILWIDDYTIPKLVQRKLDHPNDFVVSANTINNPPLGFIHNSIGALHPYFPEVKPPQNRSRSWKPSQNPYWKGPRDYTWSLDRDPPYPHHRWLRVKDDRMMSQTPAAELKYEVWGTSYASWAIAAQMHYSLFENIERNLLDLYKFPKPWHMNGERIRINFICIYADDILNTDIKNWPKGSGDEDMIAIELPKKLRRPVVILGDALASHFQYSDQGKLAETDILMRYRALALDRAKRKPRIP